MGTKSGWYKPSPGERLEKVKNIGARIPVDLHAKALAYCEQTGGSLERFIIDSMLAYVDLLELEARLTRPARLRAAAIHLGAMIRKRDPVAYMKFSEAVESVVNGGFPPDGRPATAGPPGG